jgi:hypothetical protein
MGKHLHHPLLLAILCALLLCPNITANAQTPQAEEKPADTIRGVVINSVTQEPIARALVYSPDNRFATMTNSEGRFEFDLAKAANNENKDQDSGPVNDGSANDGSANNGPTNSGGPSSICSAQGCTNYTSGNGGAYSIPTLNARKPGFLNESSSTQDLRQDTTRELTISLTPEALVLGRVVLPTSEPSDTIQLELYRRQVQEGRAHWVRAGGASTRLNGEFRFADLPPGSYRLLTRELMDRDPLTFDPRGQLYGYPPMYFPNATDFAAAQVIQLTAGQIFQADISLVRHPYYQVKVPVVNVPANVRGLNVVVSPQGHRGPGFALGYNDEDQRIEGLMPNGNYTLEASNFGPIAAAGVSVITVKGAEVDGPRMTLVANGSISVNVKEEFTSNEDANQTTLNFTVNDGAGSRSFLVGGPRRYLNIYLQTADDFGQERTIALRPPTGPEDDSLVIDGVQPGRYWVKVDASRGFVAAVTSGTTDLRYHPLVVGPGGSSPPIEITMRNDTAELDGAIEGAPAQPEGSSASTTRPGTINGDSAFAHVYCIPLPDSAGEFKEIWVRGEGKFGPKSIAPGTYRVLAFDRPQPDLEYRNPEAMRAYETKGLLVRLVAGQKEHLQLPLISKSE